MKGKKIQEAQSSHLLSVERTESKFKKDIEDRFLTQKKRRNYSCKKREANSPESYESFLSDTLLASDEDQSVRNFAIARTTQKRKACFKGDKIKSLRKTEMKPFRKFKVHGWKDNYYTNLLDWSYNNFICAGNLNELCLYNMAIDDEFESSLHRKYLIGINGESITSLKCCPVETKIALGYSNGSFKIYDYIKEKTVYQSYHHLLRIAAIQWTSNLILTGSKDQFMKAFDPRSKKTQQMATSIERAHCQEVCGVKQKENLVCTGGNDNKVFIYDLRNQLVLGSYSHNAAVKAITWASGKTVITGGGTADKKIKFWNEDRGIHNQVDTGSQVCSLNWASESEEIVSCQGFSLNQIIIWNKEAERQFTFHGHSSRVLYSALSPAGQYLASGAGDQHLKIWKLFPIESSCCSLLFKELR